MRIIRKIFEVGLINFIIGCIKRIKYSILCNKYGFDKWHVQPYELRRYAIEAGKYISQYRPELVVDIGCGLGDLLRHIRLSETGQGFGYDLSESTIKAAKKLSKSKKLDFQVGSFDQVNFSQTIDYLSAFGFMHGSPEEKWKPQFDKLLKHNRIHYIVVDVFPEVQEMGQHRLDFSKILPPNFKKVQKMGPFMGSKYIEVWVNRDMESHA